jgi:hypothetical protein
VAVYQVLYPSADSPATLVMPLVAAYPAGPNAQAAAISASSLITFKSSLLVFFQLPL